VIALWSEVAARLGFEFATAGKSLRDVIYEIREYFIKAGYEYTIAQSKSLELVFRMWQEHAERVKNVWALAMGDLLQNTLNIVSRVRNFVTSVVDSVISEMSEKLTDFIMEGEFKIQEMLTNIGRRAIQMIMEIFTAWVVRQLLFLPGGIPAAFSPIGRFAFGYQQGGLVQMPGMVHPGEFVIRREVVSQIGPARLETLNRGQGLGTTIININAIDASSFVEFMKRNKGSLGNLVGEQVLANSPLRTNVLKRTL